MEFMISDLQTLDFLLTISRPQGNGPWEKDNKKGEFCQCPRGLPKDSFQATGQGKRISKNSIMSFSRGDKSLVCGEVRGAVICRLKYERGWNCPYCYRYMQMSSFQFLIEYYVPTQGRKYGRWNVKQSQRSHRTGIVHGPTGNCRNV